MGTSRSVADGLDAHNAGRSVDQWARKASAADVRALAAELGVAAARTKAGTAAAIAKSPRPAAVAEGLRRLEKGEGISTWGKKVRAVDVRELAEQVGVPVSSKAATLQRISDAGRQTRIVRKQDAWLRGVLSSSSKSAAGIYDDARRELFEGLSGARGPSPVLRLQTYLTAIRRFQARLQNGMQGMLDGESAKIQDNVMDTLAKILPEADRADMAREVSRLRKLKAHRFEVARFASDVAARLHRQAVQQANSDPARVAANLAGKGKSSAAAFRNRASLVARTEIMRSHNEAQIEAARTVTPKKGRRLVKRLSEIMDNRNHPFSRAAHNIRAEMDQPFKVSVAAVNKWAAVLKKGVSGIFWPIQGSHYQGMSLPAHFNDRGRVVIGIVDA